MPISSYSDTAFDDGQYNYRAIDGIYEGIVRAG